jgi:MraZ protein
MFIGEFSHKLDGKGRVAVPAKFRDELGSSAVLTKGLDTCLVLYPKHEWELLAEKLAAMPLSKANTRAFSRLMLAGAMEVDLDAQGRIMIPDYLRAYSGIDSAAVVTGLYNRIEIWSENVWTKYRNAMETESEEIAEALGDLGI